MPSGRLGRPAGRWPLALPMGVSAVAHLALLSALVLRRTPPVKPLPPMYRVDLVAAPPGPRAAGIVTPAPVPPAAQPAPPPPSRQAPEKVAPLPTKQPPSKTAPPKVATPNPAPATTPPKAGPVAGGGPAGGRGADVANVRTQGIEFPYPGYLANIVRQIALRFRPDEPGALRAEVFFLVHRDGTVSDFRFLTRSGVYGFDLEAQGAIESAASARAFGALPAGFNEDVLPVIFSFDPNLLR